MRIGAPSRPGEPLDSSRLTVGESTLSRLAVASAAVPIVSGTMYLTYWTAKKTEQVANMRLVAGSTAAAATPTLVRAGVFSVAANDDLTLLGAIANDPSIFSASFGVYTRAVAAPFAKIAGQRYATGILLVTGVATPTLAGAGVNFTGGSEPTAAPRLTARVVSLADLPASVAAASLSTADFRFIYSVVTP